MEWHFNSKEALYVQIAGRLRTDILNGKYRPDEQIPPVRQLAFEASVNPNTMQKALVLLEEEGLLHARGTVGRFVTSDPDILSDARKRMCRQALRDMLDNARSLGITSKEIIDYINEEEDL